MLFVVNLVLALVWVIVTGTFSLSNLVFGFALAALTLLLIREQIGTAGYFRRIGKLAALAGFLVYDLFASAWRVARTVLSPRLDIRPGIFVYPLTVDRDYEIALLANLVCLTPGSIVFDVSEDRRFLFVHALDCSDADEQRRLIAEGFERRVLEAFR